MENRSIEYACGKGAQTRHKCIEVFAFAQINLHKSQWALGAHQATPK